MSIIIKPAADTDLSNAQEVAESALPQTIGSLAAGDYDIGRIAWRAGPVTVSASAVPRATKAANTDAYLEGPGLPEGVGALTVRLKGLNVPVTTLTGYRKLFDWISQTYELGLDTRAGQRNVKFTMEDGSTNIRVFDAVISNANAIPTGDHDVLVSAGQNVGGQARFKMWVDGVLAFSSTSAAPADDVFTTIRGLNILPDPLFGASLERFTAWTDYTEDGDTSGLTLLPGHDISAEEFNTGNGTINKMGADDFIIG